MKIKTLVSALSISALVMMSGCGEGDGKSGADNGEFSGASAFKSGVYFAYDAGDKAKMKKLTIKDNKLVQYNYNETTGKYERDKPETETVPGYEDKVVLIKDGKWTEVDRSFTAKLESATKLTSHENNGEIIYFNINKQIDVSGKNIKETYIYKRKHIDYIPADLKFSDSAIQYKLDIAGAIDKPYYELEYHNGEYDASAGKTVYTPGNKAEVKNSAGESYSTLEEFINEHTKSSGNSSVDDYYDRENGISYSGYFANEGGVVEYYTRDENGDDVKSDTVKGSYEIKKVGQETILIIKCNKEKYSYPIYSIQDGKLREGKYQFKSNIEKGESVYYYNEVGAKDLYNAFQQYIKNGATKQSPALKSNNHLTFIQNLVNRGK